MSSKEIVLYTNKPYTKFRWLGYMSLVQIGFVVVNFIMMPTPRLLEERAEALKNRVRKKEVVNSDSFIDEYETNPEYDPATLLQRLRRLSYSEIFAPRNIIENLSSRPLMSVMALGSVTLIGIGFTIYCRRMAHIITLLPGDRIRFTSFSPFAAGKPSSIELPLRDISCVHGRQSTTRYSILKFRGHYGYHLVQKEGGQFLEPELYDQHLGYAKSWARK